MGSQKHGGSSDWIHSAGGDVASMTGRDGVAWTSTVGALHQTTSRTSVEGTETYSYDATGRVASVVRGGSVTFYRYDGLGRLRAVENGVGLVRAFDRDADGVIVRRWGGSAPASFEVAGWSEEVGRPAKEDYTPQVSGAAGQLQFHLVEFDGTNIVSSRPLGAVVGFRRQGAYGQEFTSGGEPELRRSFHGHREEPGLRLTAAGPRHLLLADGRWLQPEPLLYLGIPEELRSDPRALMMYRYGHNAPSVYADRSGLNGEPQVEDGMIKRDAPDEPMEEPTWVVWPDEFAGTTFIEQVIRSTNVGGGPTSAAEKERRAAEVPVVQASVKEAAALAAVSALVGAIRVVNESVDATRRAGKLTSIGENVWQSTGGLI